MGGAEQSLKDLRADLDKSVRLKHKQHHEEARAQQERYRELKHRIGSRGRQV